MVKSSQFFRDGGSTSQGRSRRFILVQPEFASSSKMASLTPESSIRLVVMG